MAELTPTIIKSMTIAPGETVILPSGAVITSTNGELTSDCATLPEPVDTQCYYMLWTQTIDTEPTGLALPLMLGHLDFNETDAAWDADGGAFGGSIVGVNINNELKVLNIPFTETQNHIKALENNIKTMASFPVLQDLQFRYIITSGNVATAGGTPVPGISNAKVYLVQWYMVFKTFPNVAETMYIQFAGSTTGAMKTVAVGDEECYLYALGTQII